MNQIGRRFQLSEQWDRGLFCSDNGVFLGGIPLLQRASEREWRPRPIADLNCDLSECYGLPVQFGQKIGRLEGIAKALSVGDVLGARIRTLHLEIPDPPMHAEPAQTTGEIIDLSHQLRASGLLKADWDPAKHPRWPAGSAGSIGGEFAPTGTSSGDLVVHEQSTSAPAIGVPNAPAIPVQFAIPAPYEIPGGIPFPSEVVPPPAIPDIAPRNSLKNPYPDRPECERQWAEAIKYCTDLIRRGKLGTDEYRGKGRIFQQCVMGQVDEDCGGSIVERS